MVDAEVIYLIGCGSVFDAIAVDQTAYAANAKWQLRRAESVEVLAHSATALLSDIPSQAQIFIAVDSNAINFARLELYAPAKLQGIKLATLLHPTAYVAPDASLGDNVWVGPAATISNRCKLGGNVLVNSRARLDAGVQIGMHGWVGPGTSIGADAALGNHCVIGADVRVMAGVSIGRNCFINQPVVLEAPVPAGTFIEPVYTRPARIVGMGYSLRTNLEKLKR